MRSTKLEPSKRFAEPMSKSPNAGRVSEFYLLESTACCNEPSTEKEINATTRAPWPGDDGFVQDSILKHHHTIDAKENYSVSTKLFWGLVTGQLLLYLWRALIVDFAKLLPATVAVQETACIDTVNKEKEPTSVGLVNCEVGSSSSLSGEALSPYDEPEPIVLNSLDQRSNNPGSSGSPAITYSENTGHIPMEHNLTESELHNHRSNTGNGRFALRSIKSHINNISRTFMGAISLVFNSLVTTISENGGIHMKLDYHVIRLPKCFRRVHSAFKLDHLRTTHVYMTMDGTDPAIAVNRHSTDEEFIFDSGAEDHVTGNFALLSRITAVENGCGILTASEHFMPALCSGSLIIDGFKVIDVLFVPGVIGTIFSVSKLDDLGYSTEFIGRECFVRDARTRDLVGKGRRSCGLYKVDYLEIPLDRA